MYSFVEGTRLWFAFDLNKKIQNIKKIYSTQLMDTTAVLCSSRRIWDMSVGQSFPIGKNSQLFCPGRRSMCLRVPLFSKGFKFWQLGGRLLNNFSPSGSFGFLQGFPVCIFIIVRVML